MRGLIRNPDHAVDLRADGAEPVVFAAGAGPGSGPQRKGTIDRDGAIKQLEAARGARVDRYLMISSIGAENSPDGEDTFSVYLRAKAQADEALMASDRESTIVRPGLLTDDPGSGRVRNRRAAVSRTRPARWPGRQALAMPSSRAACRARLLRSAARARR